MLRFILGTSGTGKTHRALAALKERAQNGLRGVFLVPEQFSSSAETMVYTALGDALSAYVEVYSFTSLAEAILKQYGGVAVQTLTDAGRVVLLRRAMDGLGDALESYRGHRGSMRFCGMCADAVKELKIAGVAPEEVLAAADGMGADGGKLRELALIYAAYEGLLQNTAMDPSDRIDLAAQRVTQDFFADTAVFIDNFDGFTAPQYHMLARLVQAQECTVTLCCDGLSDHDNGYGLFSPVKRAAARLRRLAAKSGVEIAQPVLLTEDVRHRGADGLACVGTLLCGGAPAKLTAEGVYFTPARGLYDECKTVAAQIAALAAQDVPYSDIAVICRLLDDYAAPLTYELSLANIPCFMDAATTPEFTAPVAFVRAALALLAHGLHSEGVLRLLKTDLCGYALQELAALENYAYTWQPSAAEWRAPFTHNPEGFGGEPRAEELETLAQAERVRAQAVPRIERFLQTAKNADASALSRALYVLLTDFGADKLIEESGDETLLRDWNLLMELLDALSRLLDGETVAPAEYDELLLLVVRATDVGHVPQTQNVVTVTTADRMRLRDPQYCFVLGLSDGAFPKTVGYSGLLTHADRERLVQNGAELPGSFENRTLLEQMFFYRALTAPARGLYLSAVDPHAGGAPYSAALQALVPLALPPLCLTPAQKAPTPAAALDLLGITYREDTPEAAALAAALTELPEARRGLDAMDAAAQRAPYAVHDTALLSQFLGDTLQLAPTRLEQYYRCRFCYFLEHVLRVRPRRKAELSPIQSGNLTHHLLEHTLRRAGAGFAAMPRGELTELVREITQEYVDACMPGTGARFAYLLERLKANAVRLLLFLQEEQKQGGFRPIAFEQSIGADGLTPMHVQAPNGHAVSIIGKIDRVDAMERDGKRFVRVVDYKTGDKHFRLDEVYCGLDTQMLFYLFAAAQDMDATPAGVLYVISDGAPTAETRAAAKGQIYRVDGLVLDDPAVLHAMDSAASGLFVPFSFKKDGAPRASDKLASLAKLGNIEQHLEQLVVDLARALYAGEVDAQPLCAKSARPCDVCEYWAVCCHESGVNERAVQAPANVFAPNGGTAHE